MNKLTKDFLLNFLITFILASFSFLINRYFVIYLGIYNLGIMKLFTQLLAYLNLADMGLVSASTYALYKPLSEKNYEKVSVIISTISNLYNKIFLFILIAGVGVTPVIPFFIKDKVVSTNIYLYWIAYVIGAALNYTFVKYNILLIADQKFILVRYIQGGTKLITSLLQIYILIKFQSFLFFISINLIENLLQFIILKKIFKRRYTFVIYTKERENEILKNLKNLFFHKFSTLIVFNTDMILLSKFVSIEIVAIYASYQMVINIIYMTLNVFLNVLRPKIGKKISKNSNENNYRYFKNLNILFIWISLFFSLSFFRLIDKFIILWLNKNFVLSKFSLILITINLFITSSRAILEIFKEAKGYFDDIQLPIAESIINFIVSIALVKSMGIVGVLLGTVISNIIIVIIAKPILVFKNCFKKSKMEWIKLYSKYLFLIFFSGGISFFLLEILLKDIKVIKWIDWLKLAVINSIILSVVLFTIFLFSNDFREYFRRHEEK